MSIKGSIDHGVKRDVSLSSVEDSRAEACPPWFDGAHHDTLLTINKKWRLILRSTAIHSFAHLFISYTYL
ncbi:hypothetical protein [Mucilaginibacter sp. SG564]|uniref:hypothetical protein n=1 Tax=Mucilaginibacter sp. SG564 TaxID=2587022 RepID=UPI0015552A96|nr:hypothetical protein [Mucilaginibacter sp. SG564]NOW96618.1 hypothetical protein [Mucilaginibacter sp. SG564]